ncbi:hypothetical protein BCR43DRAFT_491936, partial [Syncephalastrum racemosum]
MFSNWFSTVRDHMKVPKSPEGERDLQQQYQQQYQQQQQQLQQQQQQQQLLQQDRQDSVSTASTVSEQGEQDKTQYLEPADFKLQRTHSTPVHRPSERNPSISEAIPIQRRRSLFGIASDSADDYVQKDLISSSWS